MTSHGAASGTVERWGCFEWSARSEGPEPVAVSATFTHPERSVEVEGFHDGEGVHRVRYMPDAIGTWTFRIQSADASLGGQTGAFECVAPSAGQHGPVVVAGRHHFAHADGTPYRPFGTTCYAWIHQPEELQRETLATLRDAPFNKLRMCVFPKHYVYNTNEPPLHPFLRGADGALDLDRPDPRFFQHLEARIGELGRLGIEVDLILFHPYDRWGYATMTARQDERYLRYVIARLAAHRNVWWSVANEYDLMDKALERWDALLDVIAIADPYRHLTSIHHDKRMYDHRRSPISHVSVQSWDVQRTREWRDAFGRPVINDEPEYEGDIPSPWGNISARELVHRCWVTVVNGGYAGHGESYLDDEDVLWWAKGGRLRGESASRIGFLRRIVEEAAGPFEPAPGA